MMNRGRALIASLMIGSVALTGVVAAPAAHADVTYVPVVNTASRPAADFGDALTNTMAAFNKYYDSFQDEDTRNSRPSLDNVLTGLMGANVATGGVVTTSNVGIAASGEVEVYNTAASTIVNGLIASQDSDGYISQASNVLSVKREALQSIPVLTYYLFKPFFGTDAKPTTDQVQLIANVYVNAMQLRAVALNFQVADANHFAGTGNWTVNSGQAVAAGFTVSDDKKTVSFDASKQGGLIGTQAKAQNFLNGIKSFVTSSYLSS
ncbi:MAG: hypothetical protein Q3972_08800 [Corynebacterium sp.]|nr:hypothetical protein [Corynebacterium sp.]